MNANGNSESFDDLMRRFFQAELPASWPTSPRPAPNRLFSKRLVLAASLIFLLIGQAYLFGIASRMPALSEPTAPGGVEAMNRDGRPTLASPRNQ